MQHPSFIESPHKIAITPKHPLDQPPLAKDKEKAVPLSKEELIRNYHKRKREDLWCKVYDLKTYPQVLDSHKFALIHHIQSGQLEFQKIAALALEIL